MKKLDLKGIKFEVLQKEYLTRFEERQAFEEAQEKAEAQRIVESGLKENNLYVVYVHRPPVELDVFAASPAEACKRAKQFIKDDSYVLQEDYPKLDDLRFESSKEIKNRKDCSQPSSEPVGIYDIDCDFYDSFYNLYEDEITCENILERKAKLGKSK